LSIAPVSVFALPAGATLSRFLLGADHTYRHPRFGDAQSLDPLNAQQFALLDGLAHGARGLLGCGGADRATRGHGALLLTATRRRRAALDRRHDAQGEDRGATTAGAQDAHQSIRTLSVRSVARLTHRAMGALACTGRGGRTRSTDQRAPEPALSANA
jgi:hypothetical protein